MLSSPAALILLSTTLSAQAAAPDAVQTALQELAPRDRLARLPSPQSPAVERELRRMTGAAVEFSCRGLARRADWSELVDGALEDAGLPGFLAAVPLVESGYSNWGAPGATEHQSAAPGRIPGRGLWMFIAPTARTYGLRVDETVDERLDPERETEAAVALLGDLHDTFGDWGLALAAYNLGEQAVRRAMEKGDTDDVFELIDRGLLNSYAAQVVAGSVLLQTPELAHCTR